ncbi:hypothetical protein Ocin01_12583 [Orchesella cincta]|uniref:CHK kinase-like domain-containing protein n=1 Tax=Orchesella cincta TaxID=48709 RepID=A0A1D2MM21_ORCCI|nr:hypothetical protein Ocin01_12583 [Orchesella cincta]
MEGAAKISRIPPAETSFQITKEFLELALDKEVENFSTGTGTNPGEHYLSIMYAIEMTFKGENQSNPYLIKCYPSSSPGPREWLNGGFTKELFISCACWKCGWTPSKFTNTAWSPESFILMTDLNKTSGFTMEDRIQGLDLDQTKITMKEIARLHALSWAYKQKNGVNLLSTKYPQLLSKMNTSSNPDIIGMGQLMTDLNDSCLKIVEEKLGASHPACKSYKKFIARGGMETMNAFLNKMESMRELWKVYFEFSLMKIRITTMPWMVGSHGDCWLSNLLFRYNDRGKPAAVTLVDYQLAREACPTLDLVLFLYTSIRASIRIPDLDEILRVYHDAFVRNCEALQVNPERAGILA